MTKGKENKLRHSSLSLPASYFFDRGLDSASVTEEQQPLSDFLFVGQDNNDKLCMVGEMRNRFSRSTKQCSLFVRLHHLHRHHCHHRHHYDHLPLPPLFVCTPALLPCQMKNTNTKFLQPSMPPRVSRVCHFSYDQRCKRQDIRQHPLKRQHQQLKVQVVRNHETYAIEGQHRTDWSTKVEVSETQQRKYW